jgi:hypothetical protein
MNRRRAKHNGSAEVRIEFALLSLQCKTARKWETSKYYLQREPTNLSRISWHKRLKLVDCDFGLFLCVEGLFSLPPSCYKYLRENMDREFFSFLDWLSCKIRRRQYLQVIRLGISHRCIVDSIITHADGAIDVIGCDIDIDTMAVVLVSVPSIIKTIGKY